jgi:hypothetical protein
MEKGIDSLREAVINDCKKGQDCFNENGCDHEFYRTLPQDNPKLIEMGMTKKCCHISKCSHKYCDKYKWTIERAKHYAEKTGKTYLQILEIWEKTRSYWYESFYQECNQPLLEGDNIIFYDDWIKQLEERFGKDPKKWAFVCPACGHVQTAQDFIDNKIEDFETKVYFSCIGRYINKTHGCDWTLGGLLKINKMSVIKDGQAHPVFEMAPAPIETVKPQYHGR